MSWYFYIGINLVWYIWIYCVLVIYTRNVLPKPPSSGVESMLFYTITDGKEQVPISFFTSVSGWKHIDHLLLMRGRVTMVTTVYRPWGELAFIRLTLVWRTAWRSSDRRWRRLPVRWWWTETSSTGKSQCLGITWPHRFTEVHLDQRHKHRYEIFFFIVCSPNVDVSQLGKHRC